MGTPTVDELHAALIEAADLLEQHGNEPELAVEVRRSADEVGAADAHGARRYLARNRALLDLGFSAASGNAETDAAARAVQLAFDALHSRAFSLAQALLRAS